MTDNDFPSDWPDWPEGGDVFAKLARACRPDLTFEQLRTVADRLYGTPAAQEWKPIERQDARSVLLDEATAVAMLVQAWADRAEWAVAQCVDDKAALRNYCAAGRVLHSVLRYVPGRNVEDDEDGAAEVAT